MRVTKEQESKVRLRPQPSAGPQRGPELDRASDSASERPRRFRGERGDVGPLVVVTPVMVFIVMLVIQMGLYYHARSVMSAAAQDGARAYQNEGGTSNDAKLAANQILSGSGSLLLNEVVHVGQSNGIVTVKITANVKALIPGFGSQLAAEASGPREGFTRESSR